MYVIKKKQNDIIVFKHMCSIFPMANEQRESYFPMFEKLRENAYFCYVISEQLLWYIDLKQNHSDRYLLYKI